MKIRMVVMEQLSGVPVEELSGLPNEPQPWGVRDIVEVDDTKGEGRQRDIAAGWMREFLTVGQTQGAGKIRIIVEFNED